MQRKLSEVAKYESIWQHIEIVVKTLNGARSIEERKRKGDINDEAYEEFKTFESDAYEFMDLIIQYYNESCRAEHEAEFVGFTQAEKLSFMKALLRSNREYLGNPNQFANRMLINQLSATIGNLKNLVVTDPKHDASKDAVISDYKKHYHDLYVNVWMQPKRFLPYARLSFAEFLAIKNEFTAGSFTLQTDTMPNLVVSHFIIYTMAKVLRMAKRL